MLNLISKSNLNDRALKFQTKTETLKTALLVSFSVGRPFILFSGWITRIFDAHTVRLFDAVFKHRRNCCKSVIIFVVSAPVVHLTYAFSTVSRKKWEKKTYNKIASLIQCNAVFEFLFMILLKLFELLL